MELPDKKILLYEVDSLDKYIQTMKKRSIVQSYSLPVATAFFLLLIVLFACEENKSAYPDHTQLKAGFVNPPDTIQTSVYWYWISDHISEQGVINDLHAMKKAGINRAFIGNIGLDDAPLQGGKVLFGTEEWWKILHTALKTATELDIEIGIFNSPGWSQSGGPWVKPSQAMRYLASAPTVVEGGQKIDILLDKPGGDFEDFKVIAYPAINEDGKILNKANTRLTASVPVQNIYSLIDAGQSTETIVKGDQNGEVILNFNTTQPVTVRSLRLFTAPHGINNRARLEVKEGNEYRTLSEFLIDRHNSALNVGFDPLAPVVIAFPPVQATGFRLIISGVHHPIAIREIELSGIPYIERYPEKTLAKMFQSPLPYWHEYQWRQQPESEGEAGIIAAGEVLDIITNLSGDRLQWEAPEGTWVVLRTGMVPTGVTNAPASREATGLEVDKMSRQHVEAHFEAFMGEVVRRIPAEDRESWNVVVQDSYETGGQNFTDGFCEAFRERYGYDMLPFIPVFSGVVVESEDISNRFLWDLRRLVADKVAYDYVGGLRDVAHKYGLTTWLENYGHWGFPGEFLQYGGQSDEIGGEFWGEGDLGDIENRAASSCGHIYGKNKISAESFTTAGDPFRRYPALLKQRGDRFLSEGINNTLLHVYIHQPYEDKQPGMNAWFSTEFNRFNTWFSHMDLFTDYLKRVNFMLQQGLNVADVAYFIGEDAPKMTGITDPALPEGYQFDYINGEVILRDLFVKDGLLTLPHGTQYRMLVLPPQETMRPELLAKISQLVEQGGVVLGPAPNRAPGYENYPQADAQVRELAASLWGEGKIMTGTDMAQALEQIGCVPDFKKNTNQPVLYGHRTCGNIEIYFVTNQSSEAISFSPEFRVKGLQPECWEPTTGKTRMLLAYQQTSTGTVVPLQLDPLESVFIVFANKAAKDGATDPAVNFPERRIVGNITTDWTLRLDPEKRGSEEPLHLSRVHDLTRHSLYDVCHYSGTMVYTRDFDLEDTNFNQLFVNLNDVAVMAKVKINGQYAGGVWTAPYRVDITGFVRQGTNTIEVEVVNTWVNRIIGDMNLPENERQVWLPINSWNADSPLQKSGLIGPVVLEGI